MAWGKWHELLGCVVFTANTGGGLTTSGPDSPRADGKKSTKHTIAYNLISKLVPHPQLLVAPGIPVILN